MSSAPTFFRTPRGRAVLVPPLALSGRAVYARNAVKQPFINVEEKIDRFVGRRTRSPEGLKTGMGMQAAGLQSHRAFKHRWLAKGVHRFKTHEEADAWMMKMLARSNLPKI